MAKIKLYKQNTAPSFVGVPEMDNSGAILASAISSTAASSAASQTQLASQANAQRNQNIRAVGSFVGALGQDLNAAMSAKKTADGKQEALNNEAAVTTNSTDLEILLDNARTQVRKDYENNPSGAPAAWDKVADETVTQFRSARTMNQAVDNDVTKRAMNSKVSGHKFFSDWVIDANSEKAKNDLEFTGKNLKRQGTGELGDLLKTYSKAEALRGTAFNLNGKAYADYFVQDVKEGALINHLEARLRDNPNYVETFIKQGNANGIMDATKQGKYLDDAGRYQEAIFKHEEFTQKVAAQGTLFKVDEMRAALNTSRDKNGNPNIGVATDIRRQAELMLNEELKKPEPQRRREVIKELNGFVEKTANTQKEDVRHKEHMASLARTAAAAEKSAGAAVRSLEMQRRSDIRWGNYLQGTARAEERRVKVEAMSTPENLGLLIKAGQKYEIATRDSKLNNDPDVELGRINEARALINQADNKNLYTLPGSPPSQYVAMQKTLNARLERVQGAISTKQFPVMKDGARPQDHQWYNPGSYGQSPMEKHYARLAQGAPDKVVNAAGANVSKARKMELDITWSAAYSNNVSVYKDQHKLNRDLTDAEMDHVYNVTTKQIVTDMKGGH